MCGIAGYHILEDTAWDLDLEKLANELLDGIEHRGHDATGILSVPSDNAWSFRLERAPVTATSFMKHRRGLVPNPRTVLLHTRATTKGNESNISNNHPVVYKDTFVTHNGVIGNDDSLFKSEDLKRHAEVDSEIIAALLSKHGLEKANLALKKLSGGFAIAAVDLSQPDSLLLAKGPANPFFYIEYKNILVWASTEFALKNACEKVFLKNGRPDKVEELQPGNLLLVNPEDKVQKFDFEVYQSQSTQSRATSSSSRNTTTQPTTTPKTFYDQRTAPSSPHMQALCKCTHNRFWHQGVQGMHGCSIADCECSNFAYDMAGPNMTITTRTQEKLKEVQDQEKKNKFPVLRGGETVWLVLCEWCSHYAAEDEMEIQYGYDVCPSCQAELETVGTGGRDSGYHTVTEDVDPDEDELEEPLKTILETVALECGLSLQRVYWLLFTAEDDDMNDTNDTNDFCLCDEAFKKISKRYDYSDSDEKVGVKVVQGE